MVEASVYTIDLHDCLVSKDVKAYLTHIYGLKLITESAKRRTATISDISEVPCLRISISWRSLILFVVTGDDRLIHEPCRLHKTISEMNGSLMQ